MGAVVFGEAIHVPDPLAPTLEGFSYSFAYPQALADSERINALRAWIREDNESYGRGS
jgi:hypothetical protein